MHSTPGEGEESRERGNAEREDGPGNQAAGRVMIAWVYVCNVLCTYAARISN